MTRIHRIVLGATLTVAVLLAANAAHAGCSDRPGTPTNVVAEPLSSSSIILKWRETTRENERPLGVPTHDIEVTDGNGKPTSFSKTGIGNYGERHIFKKLDFNKKYCFRIRARTEPGTQGCVSAQWSAWTCATTSTPPLGGSTSSNGCKPGFVPRAARASDKVCVTQISHNTVLTENRLAASRRQPGGGAYGPNTCKQGYVWREAFVGDVVCVTPARRSSVKAENARK